MLLQGILGVQTLAHMFIHGRGLRMRLMEYCRRLPGVGFKGVKLRV